MEEHGLFLPAGSDFNASAAFIISHANCDALGHGIIIRDGVNGVIETGGVENLDVGSLLTVTQIELKSDQFTWFVKSRGSGEACRFFRIDFGKKKLWKVQFAE